jgi:photosystem II stability/assembly factor-like uncharacterized protein
MASAFHPHETSRVAAGRVLGGIARRGIRFAAVAALTALPLAAQTFDPALFSGMRWRMAGPFRGGRVLAVALVPGQPEHFYFGSVGGGVWETHNAGRTWDPIFDGQPVASIGAIAVAPSDPRVIYVGSGEADMRSDISYGNGVYRSTDGGRTWERAGLEPTRQIGRIVVDARDPNRVYVAALGHAYGPNPERGVYRSTDGGHSWSRVLYKDEDTGAIDLAIDPSRPRTLLAAMWQTRRPPWNAYPPSNGPGSGLYRSDDGGDTWKPVGGGFPTEKLGRIGVAFAPSDPHRVYAIVDAKPGGLWVSDDGGDTWNAASRDKRIWERGWYFGGVTVDSKDPNTVYVCDVAIYRSTDGGKTFLPFKGAPGGDDYHELRIDPADPQRMILGSDQGAVVTVDGGRTWSSWYNQPTAQFYHAAADDRVPYWLYGAQQDSGAAATPSRTDYSAITSRDWKPIAAGGENGYVAPDPAKPDVVYGGGVTRFDWTTLQDQELDPTLAYPGEYRGEWTLPLTIASRGKGSHAVYFGNQFVFRSTDEGRHWEKISPDLTRDNAAVPKTLDPATAADSTEAGPRRGVVYALATSPLRDGLVWAGTNDGLLWVTRDDGGHWSNVTPAALTAWSSVAALEPSHFDADTIYAAVERHRLDDVSPYVYRSRDGGKTWTAAARGIPNGSYVHVVREDPERRGLLYAGTETGVFVSFDDGDSWQALQHNLPNCSVRDLVVRRGDLVAGTHGRSFWILDDLSPLRQLDAKAAESDAWLFAPRAATRIHPAAFQGTPDPKDEPLAENPPRGAVLDYWLKAAPAQPIAIEILDASGQLVRRYASDDAVEPPDLQKIAVTPNWMPPAVPPDAAAGMHRFVWDLHYATPKSLLRGRSRRGAGGVWAPPGNYTVRLTAGGRTLTQPLVVERDSRISATPEDMRRQFDLARQIESERVSVAEAYAEASALRKQSAGLAEKASGKSAVELASFTKDLTTVAGPALDPEEAYDLAGAAPTSLLRLSVDLARFQGIVESADAAPTPDAVAGFAWRKERAAAGLASWRDFVATRLPKANRVLESEGMAPLRAAD